MNDEDHLREQLRKIGVANARLARHERRSRIVLLLLFVLSAVLLVLVMEHL